TCLIRCYCNTNPTTVLYTLSLHDALPISFPPRRPGACRPERAQHPARRRWPGLADRLRPRPSARTGRRLAAGQPGTAAAFAGQRSEEHTSELQSRENLVCRLLLEKKNKQ